MLNHVSQAVMRSTEEFASAILKADRGIEPLQDFAYTQVHCLRDYAEGGLEVQILFRDSGDHGSIDDLTVKLN